jgi:CspA family cold shock protein
VATGILKWFNPTRGFGLIEFEDGSGDTFVHISTVERSGLSGLNEGQRLSFELVLARNGKMAADNLAVQD